MSKYDISSIVSDVQKLYSKDKKSKEMLTVGSSVKKTYTENDGILLDPNHPFVILSGLPVLPYNKINQVSGNPDTGKSTFCGSAMAAAQKSGAIVVLLDTEDKFDPVRFDNHFGGNSEDVILIKTNEILQGGEKVRKTIVAIKTKYPDAKILFGWDSVGGAQSRSHAERELDDEKHGQPGQDAKENAQVMKMLVSLINKYPDSISVLLVNQVYAKIGFMQSGNQESGGKKIEFHSSFIVELSRVKTLTKQVKGVKVKYGILSKAKVKKNHLSQSDTSIHEQVFEITAKGYSTSESEVDSESEED